MPIFWGLIQIGTGLRLSSEPSLFSYKSHRKRISTSNLIERLFGEGKRRTKVIPKFPTEKSCLTLFDATLIDSSKRWYGVRMSINITQELDKLWEKVMPGKDKNSVISRYEGSACREYLFKIE